MTGGKAKKGTVVIQSRGDRLRLIWRYGGNRYFLSLGLPDTPMGRAKAELKAKQIERDIYAEQFDSTLEKYRAVASGGQATVVGVFERFMESKALNVDPRTMDKFSALRTRLTQHFKTRRVDAIGELEAGQFINWLLTVQKPVTAMDRLATLKECWTWANRQGLVGENVWANLKIKPQPEQKPRPFTLEEIQKIITGFRGDRYYSPYANYVEFLLLSGCRPGEAAGLRWRHLTTDCSEMWIGEIMTRGRVQKTVKRGRDRTVPLPARLQSLLMGMRPENPDPDDLVFKSPKGNSIEARFFQTRAWKKMLGKLGIKYRKPYITRKTLISHGLEQGISPTEMAELVGNTPQTIYKHYAGFIRDRPRLPDLMPREPDTPRE